MSDPPMQRMPSGVIQLLIMSCGAQSHVQYVYVVLWHQLCLSLWEVVSAISLCSVPCVDEHHWLMNIG